MPVNGVPPCGLVILTIPVVPLPGLGHASSITLPEAVNPCIGSVIVIFGNVLKQSLLPIIG